VLLQAGTEKTARVAVQKSVSISTGDEPPHAYDTVLPGSFNTADTLCLRDVIDCHAEIIYWTSLLSLRTIDQLTGSRTGDECFRSRRPGNNDFRQPDSRRHAACH